MSGRKALVTGASSGIGRSIARALAAEGVELWLVGRRPDALFELAAETGRRDMHCHSLDLTRDDEIHALADRLRAECNGLDYLVHSAGTAAIGPLESASLDDLDLQYRTNVRGCYALTQALLPLLRARAGQVVVINSTVGRQVMRGNITQYAATKHAMRAIADSLREEVNPWGVRVLSVFLGRTATPMQAMIHEAEKRAYRPERLIDPDEVGRLVVDILRPVRSAEVTEISIRPIHKDEQELAVHTGRETVLVRGTDGTIRYWNDGAEQMYGFRAEETVGRRSHDVLQTDFPVPLPAIERELLERGRWSGELVHTRRDGSRIRVLSRWELLRGKADAGVTVLERNVRKLAFLPAAEHLT